ncbi:FAM32A-like protein [Tanacetum coccineum]|uniref:FAM32A-like protein n=1 Tax=Tanacetum coccineum TaxID=301880 RepID=A0ABQ5H979_9ASTR
MLSVVSFSSNLHTSLNALMVGLMSGYENVVTGKLKLKGKALDVKAGGTKKKKKNKIRNLSEQAVKTISDEISEGSDMGTMAEEEANDGEKSKGASYLDSMTPAERRYMEQRQKIDMQKMAKTSNKSHRDRLSEFNQYLANMSEHYDIPKVGPG